MPEQAARAKTEGEIVYSVVEYTAVFRTPILEAWAAPAFLIKRVLKALETWGFRLDGVEDKTRGVEKLADYAIVFRRTGPPAPGVTISVGVGKVVIAIENPAWTEAEQLLGTMNATLSAVVEIGQAEIQSQHLALLMHIQVKTRSRKEVTAPLLSPLALQMLDGDVTFPGIILQREKSSVVVDASLAYANGLFVRMVREHPPERTLQELAGILRKDEEQLFSVLGLEGIL
jgi:hypothetical protein